MGSPSEPSGEGHGKVKRAQTGAKSVPGGVTGDLCTVRITGWNIRGGDKAADGSEWQEWPLIGRQA